MPETKYHTEYHDKLRENVRATRERKNELRTVVKEFVNLRLLELHDPFTFKVLKPSSLKPLPKWYNAIAEELYLTLNDYSFEDIANVVRSCIGKSVEQLKRGVTVLQNDRKRRSYSKKLSTFETVGRAGEKAFEQLENEFSRDDAMFIVFNRDDSSSVEKKLALAEDLWLNIMEFLRGNHFEFFPSKIAADKFVFPNGDYIEPYKYEEYCYPRGVMVRRYLPKFLKNPKILEWEADEHKRTIKLREAYMFCLKLVDRQEQLKARRLKEALDRMEPWLIQAIQYGYQDDRILEEISQVAWLKPHISETMKLVAHLRKKGYKSLDGKIRVKTKVSEQGTVAVTVPPEKPSTVKPDARGQCPKGYRLSTILGAGEEPICVLVEKEPAGRGQDLGHDLAQTKKGTSPAKAVEKSQLSDIEVTNTIIGHVQAGFSDEEIYQKLLPLGIMEPEFLQGFIRNTRKTVAVKEEVNITPGNLAAYCYNKYGEGWTYNSTINACVSPDGAEKITVDYRDVLRGTVKQREPETQKGTDVEEKKTVRVKVR